MSAYGLSPSLGDIATTPFYETSYGHAHGYSERQLASKASFWDSTYQYHAPSARSLREKLIPRTNDSSKLGCVFTHQNDTQVAQELHERGGLHRGSLQDERLHAREPHNILYTRNSLRVASRYHHDPLPPHFPHRPHHQLNHTGVLQQTNVHDPTFQQQLVSSLAGKHDQQTITQLQQQTYPTEYTREQADKHDQWLGRTIPATKMGNRRVGQVAEAQTETEAEAEADTEANSILARAAAETPDPAQLVVHPSREKKAKTMHQLSYEPFNSRKTPYDSEYVSTLCDASRHASLHPCHDARWKANSRRIYEAPGLVTHGADLHGLHTQQLRAQTAPTTAERDWSTRGHSAVAWPASTISNAISSSPSSAASPASTYPLASLLSPAATATASSSAPLPTTTTTLLPLNTRISHEYQITGSKLYAMRYPTTRKVYPEMQEKPHIHAREHTYPVYTQSHVSLMRPAPLLRDRFKGEAVSEQLAAPVVPTQTWLATHRNPSPVPVRPTTSATATALALPLY